MAKLLAYFNLCPVNVGKEYFGLSPDVDPGAVITTLGRNMVIIMQLSNQKQICSWSVLDRLSTKVVYDFDSEQYVGVFMNRYLRLWDSKCVDVNNIKKIKFRRNIHDIFSLESNKKTIILYEDGNCELLENALQNRKKNPVKLDNEYQKVILDDDVILKVGFSSISNNIMITFFVSKQQNENIDLIYYVLHPNTNSKDGKSYRINIQSSELPGKVVGYTIVDGSIYPSLITTWSDGRIIMQQLKADDTDANDGLHISMLSNVNVEKPISIAAISENYIAIYGACTGQEGANLIVYNTKFRIVQTKQFFKVYFKTSNIWIIGNKIFLGLDQVLSVVPFRISKEQLCDMIGTQKSNYDNYIDFDCINEEIDFESEVVFDSDYQNKVNQQAAEYIEDYTMITELQENKKQKKNKDLFIPIQKTQETLNSLYKYDMLVDLMRDDTDDDDAIVSKCYTNPNGILILCEEFEMLTNEMENSGSCEIEITEKIVPLLIETDLEQDLIICLKKYSNISEKCLVQSLNYAVSKIINDEINFDKNLEKYELINNILSCSYSRNEILPHIRNGLDLNSVIFLLKYVTKFLQNFEIELYESPRNSEYFDSDEIILEWIVLIIDSQYQKLLLTSDSQISEILLELKYFMDKSINIIKNLENFLPSLHMLVQGKQQEEKKYSKWYSIEHVQLY